MPVYSPGGNRGVTAQKATSPESTTTQPASWISSCPGPGRRADRGHHRTVTLRRLRVAVEATPRNKLSPSPSAPEHDQARRPPGRGIAGDLADSSCRLCYGRIAGGGLSCLPRSSRKSRASSVDRPCSVPLSLSGGLGADRPKPSTPGCPQRAEPRRPDRTGDRTLRDPAADRRHRADRKQPLTVEESDRAVRLLRTQSLAEETFGDRDKANSWLRRPLIELAHEAPLAVAQTEAVLASSRRSSARLRGARQLECRSGIYSDGNTHTPSTADTAGCLTVGSPDINVLINHMHDDVSQIVSVGAEPFALDLRLLQAGPTS